MRKTKMFFLTLTILGMLIIVASCTATAQPQQPQEPDVPLKDKSGPDGGPSYTHDVQPMFDEYCISCHGPEKAENDLRLDSYDGVMKGSKSGAVVIPGWPEASTLVYVMRRPTTQDIAMPYHGKNLTPNRIKNVMNWIEAGAPNN